MARKLTTKEFIGKANLVHQNKYDYSKVNYLKTSLPIIINCKQHGEFKQKPESHLKGRGCYKCGCQLKVKSQEEFINELKKKYGEKYLYNEIEYIGAFGKIKLTCKQHESFFSTPNILLMNKKDSCCPKCVKVDRKEKQNKETQEGLIPLLITKTNNKTRILEIIENTALLLCEKHGYYNKNITALKQGYSCKKCQKETLWKKKAKVFFERAKIKHNNYYVYDETKYNGSYTVIEIICPKHGIYKQAPNDHTQGNGCPSCRLSKGELKIKEFLKNNNIKFEIQKTFNECKYKRKLRFDFYLPDYNLCIEYDGIYHFINDYTKIKTNLEYSQIRDKIKDDFCQQNNIKLIRIKYTENINTKLKFLT